MNVDTENQDLISDIMSALRSTEYDISLRNRYMNDRDRYLYQDGLWETLDVPDGFDKTKYNYLKPTVEIHTSQFMGRGFNVFSQFDKEDLELITENDQIPQDQQEQQVKLAQLRNKKKKSDADQRKLVIESVILDNGGMATFKHAAKIGSSYGETVFKVWPDFDQKMVKISLLETPQNWRPFWADSNFRDTDADGYVYQISKSWANRLYGDKLPRDAVFQTTAPGSPFGATPQGTGNTSNPLDQKVQEGFPVQTQQEMVTVVDFTGYRAGWGTDKQGKLAKVAPGKETPFNICIVGGFLVEKITDANKMPKYYRMPNKMIPQRAFGESDIEDSLMQINATIMERMSDWITVANKTLFPMIQAKGFETANIPSKTSRQMKVVAMDQDQSLEAVNMPNNFGFDYAQIIKALEDAFIRVSRIGRVLFDDPTVDANSNQALMTTLKGVIDVVETKQSIWEPKLIEMFTDILYMSAQINPSLKDLVETNDNWKIRIEWPNVLRKEDQVYRTMWLNEFNAGTISLDTYQEKIGIANPSEEIDRIRDNMEDATTAAIMGHQLGTLASHTINKASGIPPWGYVVPKISLRGDLTPNQEANLATNFDFNNGPFPPSAGPQGAQGLAATENLVNEGFIQGNAFDGGMPVQAGAPPSPQAAQGDNVSQPMSQPGSGAPAVSPAGATATIAQNHGA